VCVWGGGGRETVNRKRKLSAVFLQPIQNPSYMSHVLLLCISFFTRIGCILFMCDMYMCCLRHINDSVLSSLKMEGFICGLSHCTIFFLLYLTNNKIFGKKLLNIRVKCVYCFPLQLLSETFPILRKIQQGM
jgi:hypothetical protein